MDILDFTSNVIASIAWPSAAIFIAVLLRAPLSTLLKDVRRLKRKGLEAEFGASLGRAQDLIDQDPRIVSSPLASQSSPEVDSGPMLRLADLSPRSVVLEAWREVEAAAKNAIDSRPNKSASNTFKRFTLKELVEANLIDDSEFQLLSILKDLRNRAAHERQFSLGKEDAVEYAVMANRFASALNVATKRGTN